MLGLMRYRCQGPRGISRGTSVMEASFCLPLFLFYFHHHESQRTVEPEIFTENQKKNIFINVRSCLRLARTAPSDFIFEKCIAYVVFFIIRPQITFKIRFLFRIVLLELIFICFFFLIFYLLVLKIPHFDYYYYHFILFFCLKYLVSIFLLKAVF